jgi:hypothetical protein
MNDGEAAASLSAIDLPVYAETAGVELFPCFGPDQQ